MKPVKPGGMVYDFGCHVHHVVVHGCPLLVACLYPTDCGGPPAALRQSKQRLLPGKSPTKIEVSEKENHLKMGGFICVHLSSICFWALT